VLARKKRATGRLPAVVKLALGLLGGLCFCGATGLLEPINMASSSALRTRCAARLQSKTPRVTQYRVGRMKAAKLPAGSTGGANPEGSAGTGAWPISSAGRRPRQPEETVPSVRVTRAASEAARRLSRVGPAGTCLCIINRGATITVQPSAKANEGARPLGR
jgi:hypothetical protein